MDADTRPGWQSVAPGMNLLVCIVVRRKLLSLEQRVKIFAFHLAIWKLKLLALVPVDPDGLIVFIVD